MILIVGFFGSGCHRPRWVGLGMLIIGIGCIIYALPHFTTGVSIHLEQSKYKEQNVIDTFYGEYM